MYTDPKRVRADIPGTVEGNPVFIYHDAFNPDTAEVDDLKDAVPRRARSATSRSRPSWPRALNAYLDPIRERRAAVLAKPDRLREILFEGSQRARAVAPDTMARVRDAVKIDVLMMDQPNDFESAADAFPVKLSNFEGPLDLLLHLIKKNEVSIHDIPIALITQQYLDAIHLMQEMNLDVAGEFLVMAATLIHIKSKMLLPRPETAAGVEGEEEDPRDALVRRLLEHQKFKAAAELLHERETAARRRSGCGPTSASPRSPATTTSRSSRSTSSACSRRFSRSSSARSCGRRCCCRPSRCPSKCASSSCSARLSETEACGFEDLFADVNDRGGLIVTFLALLEMIRLKLVRVFQVGLVRPDSHLQARASGRRAAPDRRSGERITMKTDRMGGRRRRSRRRGVPTGVCRAEGDPRGADLRVARAAHAEGDLQAARQRAEGRRAGGAARRCKDDYNRPGGLQLVEVAGGYQIVDAAGSARLGAPAVPRADDAEADRAGARDAGGHRLPAADHRARDHRGPRRQHVRRAQHAARAASRSRSSAASRWSDGRSSTRRRRNS